MDGRNEQSGGPGDAHANCPVDTFQLRHEVLTGMEAPLFTVQRLRSTVECNRPYVPTWDFMSIASDPSVRAAACAEGRQSHWNATLPQTVAETPALASRSTHARATAYLTLTVATVLVVLRVIASALAIPLEPVGGVVAPTWMIEVTTTGVTPTTALVYGRDVGIQLIQVPASVGTSSTARVVPAHLVRGEVHLLSLGLTSLRVHASSPHGAQRMSFQATSPVVTVFQTKGATGVRAW